jgi:hypothetical protein
MVQLTYVLLLLVHLHCVVRSVLPCV